MHGRWMLWSGAVPLSHAAGRGGEPWANANLTQQPRDEESWPSTAHDEVDLEEGQLPLQQQPQQQPCACSQQHVQHASYSLAGQAAEGSAAAGPVPTEAEAIGRLLPPPAMPQPSERLLQQRDPQLSQQGGPQSPGAAAIDSVQQQQQQQQQVAQPRAAVRRSLGHGGAHKERLLTASPGACGSWQTMPGYGHTPSPNASVSSRGCHTGSPHARGSPSLLTSHLTKELESLRDEVLVKGDMADSLACKVGGRCSVAGQSLRIRTHADTLPTAVIGLCSSPPGQPLAVRPCLSGAVAHPPQLLLLLVCSSPCASAAAAARSQIEALEHDKHVITAAFEQVTHHASGVLRPHLM